MINGNYRNRTVVKHSIMFCCLLCATTGMLDFLRKVFRIGTVRYNWPMSAHASQAFSIAHCTDSEDLPFLLVMTFSVFLFVTVHPSHGLPVLVLYVLRLGLGLGHQSLGLGLETAESWSWSWNLRVLVLVLVLDKQVLNPSLPLTLC